MEHDGRGHIIVLGVVRFLGTTKLNRSTYIYIYIFFINFQLTNPAA